MPQHMPENSGAYESRGELPPPDNPDDAVEEPPPPRPMPAIPPPSLTGPAFMAGLAAGVLVGVPGISNFFLFWMVGCGVAAVFFFRKQFGRSALAGEAARLGLLGGFFGFLVMSPVSFVSYALIRRSPGGLVDQMREQMRRAAEQMRTDNSAEVLRMIETPSGAAVMVFTFGVFVLAAFLVLSTMGGMIAGAINRRRE